MKEVLNNTNCRLKMKNHDRYCFRQDLFKYCTGAYWYVDGTHVQDLSELQTQIFLESGRGKAAVSPLRFPVCAGHRRAYVEACPEKF